MGGYIRKFNIPVYGSGTTYDQHDVVSYTASNLQYYFVSTHDGNVGNLDTSLLTSNTHWKRFDDYHNDFADVWTPTYSTSAETEARVINSALDEGTTLLARDGINTIPLKFSLVFDSIGDREAKSLLCFFEFMGASWAFNWTTPPPYEKRLTFNFTGLRHSYIKKNVNNVTIGIERSFVIFGTGAGQTKFGSY